MGNFPRNLASLLVIYSVIIGLTSIIVYDMVWIFNIIHYNFLVQGLIISNLISISIISIVFFASRKKGKNILYTFKELLKVERLAWGLFVIALFIGFASALPITDLNQIHDVQRVNYEGLYLYSTEGHREITMVPIRNATSDDEIRVEFWVNRTQFNNVSQVSIWYYNGTHRGDTVDWDTDTENKTQDNGYPNWYWWTGREWFTDMSWFGNGTEDTMYFVGIRIPKQTANTSILIRLQLHLNETYENRFEMFFEGNFTVLYSSTENEYITDLIQSEHFYLFFLIMGILANRTLLLGIVEDADEDEDELRDRLKQSNILGNQEHHVSYPKIGDLISRSDRLIDVRNNIRNTSGVFLGLVVAFYWYVLGSSTFMFSSNFLRLGLVITIFACLGTLVLTLGSTKITSGEEVLDDALIPRGETGDDFLFGLYHRIQLQEKSIAQMRVLLQVGVIAIVITTILDLLFAFIRPYSVLLTNNIGISTLVCALALMFLAVVLFVLFMMKDFGYARSAVTSVKEFVME